MKIVQLSSESIRELRAKRNGIVKSMIDGQSGSLLVLGGAFAGPGRQRSIVSFSVFTIFFELWDRFNFSSWSYTFDDEGLIFYIRLDEDAKSVKDILIHYEDNHPLGFAIEGDVFDSNQKWTRASLGLKSRIDIFTKSPLSELMNEVVNDDRYIDSYRKRVEGFIIKGDKQTILTNILVYGYVTGLTKSLGFGMYGPNFRGSNEQMNFEKFIHLVRAYKEEVPRLFNIGPKNLHELVKFQDDVERKIQQTVLNQQSYQYSTVLTSSLIYAFIHSRGYVDIQKQLKTLSEYYDREKRFAVDVERYRNLTSGMREVFSQYVPFLQKSGHSIATLIFIMSRHDDYAIHMHNGDKSLQKVQFLAKNLVSKPDKWIELDKFCASSYIYPHDDTTLLIVTSMLDLMQRYYLKIKMLFDTQEK